MLQALGHDRVLVLNRSPNQERPRMARIFAMHQLAGLMMAATVATAQEAAPPKRPLDALPYTPSLDPAALDQSVDPCVDFSRYSCGGWIKKNPIPADQAAWDVYAKLTEENQQFLWGILDAAARPDPARDAA